MRVSAYVKNTKVVFISLMLGLSFATTSCGKSDSSLSIPGVDGPTVTLNQDDVLISMVFENVHLEGGLRYNIPKYPNSYVEISPDLQSDGTLMSFSVSLDDMFGGVDGLDPMKLPGGRNLPTVARGSLPAVAFTIEKFKGISLYLGPDVFGIFVPISGLNAKGAMISGSYKSGGKKIGTLTLVGEDTNGENAGMLLLLNLKGSYIKRLKKVAKKY